MAAKMDMRCHAIYRGDEFIDLGTLDELSNKYNIPRKLLQWLKSPTALKKYDSRKKPNSKQLIVIVVEDEDE